MPSSYATYHVLAFLSGAVVLVLEIIGARIFAPYLGAAYVVWVNVIGVILAALSLGYWLGGALADKNQRLLSFIFLGSATAVALIMPARILLPFFGEAGIGWGSLLAAVFLFAPASIILGMVSPYIIKLAAEDLAHLGRISGSIFAASTLGSIAGTFTAGFWLIPYFSISQILWGMVGILLVLSWLSHSGRTATRTVILLLILVSALGANATLSFKPPRVVYEKNSRYYNIRVHDATGKDGKTTRTLLLDGSTQSGRILGSSREPFSYVDLSLRLIESLIPAPRSLLGIGGGGYRVPLYVKQMWPDTDILVLEIDPEVTRVAEEFFFDDPALFIETRHADGRVFLNTNKKTYHLIYADAYSGGFSVPAHLASREAFQLLKKSLADDGVLLLNVVSAIEGPHGKLFRALLKTLDGVFPHKAAFATNLTHPEKPQNLIIAASKKHPLGEDVLRALEAFRYRGTPDTDDIPLLTDEHAPTDYLMESLVEAIYPTLRQYHR